MTANLPVVDISDFIGRTFTEIRGMEPCSPMVCFDTESATYVMYHEDKCCECVYLLDIYGDPGDLIETPILEAYKETSWEDPLDGDEDSWTWTFYRLRTIKGTVTLRWYGTSNGRYSEEVSIRLFSR